MINSPLRSVDPIARSEPELELRHAIPQIPRLTVIAERSPTQPHQYPRLGNGIPQPSKPLLVNRCLPNRHAISVSNRIHVRQPTPRQFCSSMMIARRARFSQSRSNRRHATPTDRCRSVVGIVPRLFCQIIAQSCNRPRQRESLRRKLCRCGFRPRLRLRRE